MCVNGNSNNNPIPNFVLNFILNFIPNFYQNLRFIHIFGFFKERRNNGRTTLKLILFVSVEYTTSLRVKSHGLKGNDILC